MAFSFTEVFDDLVIIKSILYELPISVECGVDQCQDFIGVVVDHFDLIAFFAAPLPILAIYLIMLCRKREFWLAVVRQHSAIEIKTFGARNRGMGGGDA